MSGKLRDSSSPPASWEDVFNDFSGLFSELREISFFEIDHQGFISSRIKPQITLFGYTQDDVESGLNVLQLIIPEEHDKVLSRLTKPLDTVTQADREYTGLRKDGSTFPMLVYSKPIIKNGKMIGRRGVVIDITEQKHTEEQLAEYNQKLLDKTKEMENFVVTVAHDLKTPLTGIRGFADLIFLENTSLPPLVDQYLRRIQQNTEKMALIIDDILEYSKLGILDEEQAICRLNNILDSVLSEFQPSIMAARIKVHIEPNLPPVCGRSSQITRLFVNLIDNAIKYMGAATTPREISIGVADTAADLVTYYVKDTGIGITEQDLPKLFRIFTRIPNPAAKHVSGTGLGLAHVKKIVELHGGTIWVDSKVNHGTTFYFTLPPYGN